MASRTKAKKYRYADSVLEHLSIGVAVYEVHKYRLVEANALFLTNVETFLDPCWQHGLMVGRTLAEFGAHLHSLCDIDIFRSVAESGNGYRENALRLSTPQGSISYWDWTLDLIPDADGEHHHLLQTITDVTAQVQARREANRCGELQLHAVLDQLPEGILIADTESGLINYVNPTAAHLLKTPLSDLAGSPVHQFAQSYLAGKARMDGLPISSWNFFLLQALSGEKVSRKQAMLNLPDGSNITMLISGTPLYMTFGEQKVMTGAAIVFQDIAAQKSIEQHKNEFPRLPITSCAPPLPSSRASQNF